MDFVADIESPCEACGGLRYRPDVLRARWGGRTIADILALTAAEGSAVFRDHGALGRGLAVLEETGLGYLVLGQPLETLSGGEGQRLKLAAELIKPARGETLYLFDEPTAGLHHDDTVKLLAVFRRLVGQGQTLIVVEHDLDIIAQAGRIIDLGPEGGPNGGRLVAWGTPEEIAADPVSWTGAALRTRLQRSQG